MDGDISMSLAPGSQSYGMPPPERTTFNGISMATDALARATGNIYQMPTTTPQIVDPSFSGSELSQQPLGRVQIDPRLGAFEDAYFAKPAMMQSNSFLPRFPSRLDTDVSMDRNIVASPSSYSTPHQSLASLNASAPNRRPSLAHTSTGTSLPPVRDLIEVAHQGNEAQANLSRRTSSYSSIGAADLTPSRRQSANSIPQSPMHFGNVVYPSSNTTGHHRTDSWPGLGPTDPGTSTHTQSYNSSYSSNYPSNFNSTFNSSYNSTYNPRRVPPRKVPPFPSMLGSTTSSSGANSANSVPSLSSIPSLTSAGSFETSVAAPVLDADVGLDVSAEAATANPPAQVPSVNSTAPGGGGGYKCTVPDCKATPFTTQYLLTSHMNVHSSSRPHHCPIPGCDRGPGGKGFKRKNEMKRHGLVHNSPGYVCPYCPDREHRYPRPDNLLRHVRMHHEDKGKDDPALRAVLEQRPAGVDASTTGAGAVAGKAKARKRRVPSDSGAVAVAATE